MALVAGCRSTGTPGAPGPATDSSPTCRPLDYEGRELRDGLVRVATGGGEGHAKMRAGVGLARLEADSVVHVTDEATCRRALAAYRAARGPGAVSPSAYVFRLAGLFVVHAPDGHPGQLTTVFDREFNRVANWAF